MAEYYVGQIIQGGWNFAPRGTFLCAGQLVAVSQYSALFSLIGTYFGGNGTTNFALPDLRGRSMVGWGQAQSGTNYTLGEMAGTETVSVLTQNMPQHNHGVTSNLSVSLSASSTKATLQTAPNGGTLGRSADTSTVGSIPAIYCPAGTTTDVPIAGVNLAGSIATDQVGSNVPLQTMSPFTAVTMAIVNDGIYPSRS